MKFSELNLRPGLMKALDQMGYEDLTPIQEATFKQIMAGHDLVGLAETGSGKTGACGVPLLQRTDPKFNAIQTLVLVPTRELALQYVEEISRLGRYLGIKCFSVFGGSPMDIQEAKLKHGVHILVATPGRLIDLLYNSKALSLENIKSLVLDEADQMLNMGFLKDVQFILSCITNEHQSLLFSATMPSEIENLIEGFLKNPEKVVLNKDKKGPESINHFFHAVTHRERFKKLLGYLRGTKTDQVIIFCNSRNSAGDLYQSLRGRLKSLELIHGGLNQNIRSSIFNRFKSGRIRYMIATDVAARGLDFSKVTHVVNYEMVRELENYTHRTGRAGRMGRKGTALTLVTQRDFEILNRLIQINRITPRWTDGKPLLSGENKNPHMKNTQLYRVPQKHLQTT